MEPLRLGLVGCGRIAQTAHLPAAQKSDKVRLVVVHDASPDVARRVAERFDVPRVAADLDALLGDEQVEAVVVAIPDRFHVEVAEHCLEAGKHVLVEKPLGTSSAECRRLEPLVKGNGLKLQVGAMKRHDPGVEFARRFVRDELGPILSFRVWYCLSTLRYDYEDTLFAPLIVDEERQQQEKALKANAGRKAHLLATHGAHVFDGLRYVVGSPSSVLARLEHRGDLYSWQGLVTLQHGGLGSFELTVPAQAEWTEGFEVFAENGSLVCRTDFPFFLKSSHVSAYSAKSGGHRVPVFGDTDPYKRQLDAFAESVRFDQATNPGLEESVAAVAFIEAVSASVDGGGPVALP